MIDAMLETHLISMGATVNQAGIVFLLQGGCFIIGSVAVGMVCFAFVSLLPNVFDLFR